jgi:sugar-specific transcriptional regulator TrmB
MSDQDISSLIAFGLTPLQARVYVALLKLGAVRASRICSTIGIVRPEGYRILRELSVKGVVERSLGPPATYTAVPPVKGLSVLAKYYRDKLESLNKQREGLTRSLSSLTTEVETPKEQFGLIGTADRAVFRTIQMIRNANTDYAAIISKHGLRRALDNGLAKAIVSAKRRRLRVRVISEIDSSNAKSADYIARHVELRSSQDLLFYIDIVDQKEMVFGPAFPAHDDELRDRDTDLWTNSSKFIRGMYAIFDRVWDTSPKYRK